MRGSAILALVMLMCAVPVAAQSGAEPEEKSIAPAEVTLATIETATYYDGARRDPFVPLTSGADPGDGPRFEQLRLTGVFLGSPGNSLVVLEDPMKRGHFVRAGEKIGNARLLAIHSEAADFEVEEYGAVRRHTLRLRRDDESERGVQR